MTTRVLLIDGVCNLCNGIVHFVIDRDPESKFKFAPLQSEFARVQLAALGRSGAGDALDTVVLIEDGVYYDKSSAAVRVARELEGPVRFVAWARVLPRAIRDALYDFVAKRRYRWFGKTEQCRVPTPELRARFLA